MQESKRTRQSYRRKDAMSVSAKRDNVMRSISAQRAVRAMDMLEDIGLGRVIAAIGQVDALTKFLNYAIGPAHHSAKSDQPGMNNATQINITTTAGPEPATVRVSQSDHAPAPPALPDPIDSPAIELNYAHAPVPELQPLS